MSFWKIKWRSLEGLQARLNSVLDMLNEVKRRKYNSKSGGQPGVLGNRDQGQSGKLAASSGGKIQGRHRSSGCRYTESPRPTLTQLTEGRKTRGVRAIRRRCPPSGRKKTAVKAAEDKDNRD